MNPSASRFVDNFSSYVVRKPVIVAEIKEVMNDMDASFKQISNVKFGDIEIGYYDSLNRDFQSLKRVLNDLNQDSYDKPLPKEAKESFQALHEDVKGLQLLYSTSEIDINNLIKDFFAGAPNAEHILRQKFQLFKNDQSKSEILFEATENYITDLLGEDQDKASPRHVQKILKLLCLMNNDFALNLFIKKSFHKKTQEEILELAEKSPEMLPSMEFLACLKLAQELNDKPYKGKRKSKHSHHPPEFKDHWPKIEAHYPEFAEKVAKKLR